MFMNWSNHGWRLFDGEPGEEERPEPDATVIADTLTLPHGGRLRLFRDRRGFVKHGCLEYAAMSVGEFLEAVGR